jgi:hypothetical protein
MSAQHSPTPWSIDSRQKYLVTCGKPHVDRARVASCASYDNGSRAEANAAFIVRAVNAHDELVAALRPFASLLRHFDGRASRPTTGPIHSRASGDVDGGEPEALTVEMLRAAAAALAKATGEGA